MSEYIYQLKNKYGYNKELLGFLSKLIPCLINYYGEEYKNIILDALLNCEIHFQSKDEDPKTFLNSYFSVNKEWKMPTLAGPFYHNEINLKDNQLVSKPIIYLKTVSSHVYKQFNFNDDGQVDKLIHEICHLIKGYGKLKIENGKIIDSTGLSKDIYSYSIENGIVEEKSEMLGIEEALNCVEAAQILEMMTGRKQEVHGYSKAGYFAQSLLENNEFAQAIRVSQFNGDNSWIRYFGEEQSKLLIENFDVLVKAFYVSFNDINTKEKKEALFQKIKIATDILNEFLNNYSSKKM